MFRMIFVFLLFLYVTMSFAWAMQDTDADGMDDGWERQYFGGLSGLPQEDPDQDGFINLFEARNNTHPLAASNVALGKTYTFSPEPNYGAPDPKDATDLTDGILNRFGIHTSASVNWTTSSYGDNGLVDITLDLGQDKSIAAVSFSTGYWRATQYPSHVYILVSTDGQNFYHMGDVVSENTNPLPVPERAFWSNAKYVYTQDQLNTHGRYVRLLIDKVGSNLHVDEIRVLEGGSRRPYGEVSRDNSKIMLTVRQLLLTLLRRVEMQSGEDRTLLEEIQAVRSRIRRLSLTEAELAAFKNYFPQKKEAQLSGLVELGAAQRALFKVNSRLWQKQGLPATTMWPYGHWDIVDILKAPSPNQISAPLVLHAMNRHRSNGAFMISNATSEEKNYVLSLEGLLEQGSRMRMYTVETVEMQDNGLVSSMLVPVTNGQVTVPAGMSQQIWLEIEPEAMPAGLWEGKILVRSGGAVLTQMPLRVHVSNFFFPEIFTLGVNFWDYFENPYVSTSPTKGLVKDNYPQYLEIAARYRFDWMLNGLTLFSLQGLAHFNPAHFDTAGKFLAPPDYYKNFDQWVRKFPQAQKFVLFWGLPGDAAMTQDQVTKAGLDWARVSALLIQHGWARQITPTVLYMTSTFMYGDLAEEQSHMAEVFGSDFPKILPILKSLDLKKNFAGAYLDDQPELFQARLRGWLDALEDHVVHDLGMEPERFVMFFWDETNVEDQRFLLPWLQAVVERPLRYPTRLLTYADPNFRDPKSYPEFRGSNITAWLDIMGPGYTGAIQNQKQFGNLDFLHDLVKQGKATSWYTGLSKGNTWLYVGGVLSGWVGRKYDISSVFYYKITQTNDRTMNFYKDGKSDFTSIYFDGPTLYFDKMLEAIYEGRVAYEYVTILKAFKSYLQRTHPERQDLVQEIDQQVQTSIDRVTLEITTDPNVITTFGSRDRSVSQKERVALWLLIDRLSREFGITHPNMLLDPRDVRWGDVSGDGKITAYDAALATKISARGNPTADELKRGDVNGDGKIDGQDPVLIGKKAVGLIDKFPIETS